MSDELERCIHAFPTTFERRDIEQLLNITDHRARALIRAWKAAGYAVNVTGESYVYCWTDNQSAENQPLTDRQTAGQIMPIAIDVRVMAAIATVCLVMGIVAGNWLSVARATPVHPVSTPVAAAPTATPTPVLARTLPRAAPFYWEPFTEPAGALETGTPYEPIARYGGSWVQVALVNHDGSRTPVWVVSADVVYDLALADLAPPAPTAAPPAAPPPPPVVIVREPVHVEVPVPHPVQQVVEQVAPPPTPAPVATINPAQVSSELNYTPVHTNDAPIRGCGRDARGVYGCEWFVSEAAMPQSWDTPIEALKTDLNAP